MPLERSRVIHPQWETRHRPIAEGTQTARCRITRAGIGTGTWNEATNEYDPPARQVIYPDLSCRVQQLNQPQVTPTGQQQVSTHDYRVGLPVAAAAVLLDDWVEITGGDDSLDPSLIDRHLVVTDFQTGSLLWERDLICIDNLG